LRSLRVIALIRRNSSAKMLLMVEVEQQLHPLECAPDAPIALLFAGLPIDHWPEFGTIVACKKLEWRLSRTDLNLFTVQTIGAEEGDIVSFEKTNYEETRFELPPLGDKINNLLRSIKVTTNPREKMIENLKAAKCREAFVQLKSDKHYMAQYSFVAPQVLRHVVAHPDDLGGFMLIYQKWNAEHNEKRKALDERYQYTMTHTPELLTPHSTLYIRGLINGHEVAAMIDTGAQTTVMHASLAEKLGLMEHIDQRFGVNAVTGVGGKTRPLGHVFGIDFQLSAGVISVSAIILPSDGTMSNHFILGLDVMLCHGGVIDLPNRRMTFSGHHEPILSVEECYKIQRGSI
ncbi:hypothetical protein PENTCL1PPCAC_26187, partial [Pristionchus entomophagus]